MSCTTNIGVALAYGAMPALVMGAVPRSETASANSFNTLMRSIGAAVCAAVIGVVMARLVTDFAGHRIPSETGFHTGMLIGCGAALIGAAIALVIPSLRAATSAGSPDEPAPRDEPTTVPRKMA